METVRQPRCGVGIEIPADRVCAKLVQCVERIDGIAFGLAHLLSVFILHMSHDDDVLVRRLIEDQRGDRHQGIEPSTGLVHCLGDEVCREVCLEQFLILKRIVILCERHCAGIVPAVDDLRHAVHLLSADRALDGHFVDVRTMQFDIIRTVVRHVF